MWPFKKREPFHQIKKTAAALGDAPVDYFMSAGLDFKGQTQMGYQAEGYGLGADFKLDAGKLVGFAEASKPDLASCDWTMKAPSVTTVSPVLSPARTST